MISIENLSVEFGAKPLFTDVNYVINRHDRIALVGKNGAGKSTMLKIIAGIQSFLYLGRYDLQIWFMFIQPQHFFTLHAAHETRFGDCHIFSIFHSKTQMHLNYIHRNKIYYKVSDVLSATNKHLTKLAKTGAVLIKTLQNTKNM